MNSDDSLIGKSILNYRLTEVLGEGGMGKVYLAVNESIAQEVAIKVLDPILARNVELRERFLQEARIQIALQHNNIVRVLNVHADESRYYLILERVEGESLDKVLKRRGKLPSDEAIHIMKQVLAAVGYAHSKCVVHRDLKPANILVTASGDVKVTDFGIAKVIGDSNLTRTGTSMGSPAYMSPEQVLGKKDIDHSADIYSLGATLFEMLTGRPPFVISDGGVSDSDFSIKTAHVQQEPPAIQELVPGVPVSVAEAVMKALKKNPDDRHASCAEFLEHLALCSANAPGCANGIAPRRKKLFAGVGLAVLGIVLNIVVYAKISDFAVATRRAVELEAKKNSEEAEARRKADAFNAYQLWEGSVQTLVTQYPEDYDRKDGEITPDGVFYVKWRDFWDGVRFFGTPTLDAKVDGALLIYPVKNGRQLKIRFSDLSKNEMKHDSAVQYCKDQGLRLPTIRELFDYCAAGTEKNSEGRFENHRCGNKETWSASVYSGLRSFAWRFLGNYGFVNGSGRYNSLGVRCVGGE